jgi:hypothetical protein
VEPAAPVAGAIVVSVGAAEFEPDDGAVGVSAAQAVRSIAMLATAHTSNAL